MEQDEYIDETKKKKCGSKQHERNRGEKATQKDRHGDGPYYDVHMHIIHLYVMHCWRILRTLHSPKYTCTNTPNTNAYRDGFRCSWLSDLSEMNGNFLFDIKCWSMQNNTDSVKKFKKNSYGNDKSTNEKCKFDNFIRWFPKSHLTFVLYS